MVDLAYCTYLAYRKLYFSITLKGNHMQLPKKLIYRKLTNNNHPMERGGGSESAKQTTFFYGEGLQTTSYRQNARATAAHSPNVAK